MSEKLNLLHPGFLLNELFIQPSGLSIIHVARHLQVSRKTLSKIINQHASISPEMAIKLGQAFPTTTAEFWLKRQAMYDIGQAYLKRGGQPKLTPLPTKGKMERFLFKHDRAKSYCLHATNFLDDGVGWALIGKVEVKLSDENSARKFKLDFEPVKPGEVLLDSKYISLEIINITLF